MKSKYRKVIIFVIISFLFRIPLFAEDSIEISEKEDNVFSQSYKDFKYIFTSPLRLNRKTLIPFLMYASGISLLMVSDEDIRKLCQDNKNETIDDGLRAIRIFGDGRVTLSICVL